MLHLTKEQWQARRQETFKPILACRVPTYNELYGIDDDYEDTKDRWYELTYTHLEASDVRKR